MNWLQETAQEGFAIVPEVLSGKQCALLATALNDPDLPRSRAGARHVMRRPEISQLANSEALSRYVKAVLGRDALPFRATLFDKLPTSNWLVAWHQDTALPLQEKSDPPGWGPWSMKDGVVYAHAPAEALERVLAVRLHLDDSTPSNGPLRVLPGTHRDGVLTDEQLRDRAERVPAVDCIVGQGGLILLRPLAAHASSKSTSPEPRRVIHIEYAAEREILPGMILAIA